MTTPDSGGLDLVEGGAEPSRTGVWLRGHRRLLALAAGAVVVAAAVTAYAVTRPPPPDPVVRVSVTGAADGTDSTSDLDPQGRQRGTWAYVVSTRVHGDVDTVVGVVGPGLTAPTSTMSDVTDTHPGVGSLGATAGCAGSAWWQAKDGDYRVRVRRTDSYGRVTTQDLPLGAPSDAVWLVRVQQACVHAFVQSLPAAVAAGTPAGSRTLDVTLTVTDPGHHDIWFAAAGYADSSLSTAPGPWTRVAAGGTASLHVPVTLSCTGTPALPHGAQPVGQSDAASAIPLAAAATAQPPQEQVAGVWVAVDAASAAGIDRQLAALCPADPG